MIPSSRIRRDFLDFFASQGHTVVPSSSIVPHEDPTLLFANAGMNQFKDVFLGDGTRDYVRAASTQKCLRVSGKHNDLEVVGRDTYHHTFFEMLGNWSFGDYYKKEAIVWAWELLTGVWKLPPDKLYVTVFGGEAGVPFDEEAYGIWSRETDIPKDHILRFGAKDNFWEMGDTGPCGPCTEIHIDRGESYGKLDPKTCFVNTDSDRFIELWNLVFIQYNRDSSGTLKELPSRHVDTGAGFERLCAVLQQKSSNYDTDVFQPLITRIAQLSGVAYSEREGTPHRVIADHIRALSCAIADGALPSNEGRGYVLRRLLRRAARFGRELGFREPFMGELAPVLAETMGEVFPELRQRLDHVRNVLGGEERSFDRTLDQGLKRFHDLRKSLAGTVLPGVEAFRLYDTYGFPLDLTEQLASEHGLSVDREAYEQEMSGQRSKSRDARRGEDEGQNRPWHEVKAGTSSFVGYDSLDSVTDILRWRPGLESDEIELVLAQSPFYAESGGQVGDRGVIAGESWTVRVRDTRILDGQRVQLGKLDGVLDPGAMVSATVDAEARRATERNHTATHLLQAALRQVLGDHVHQEGSLVEPERLRFDFSHSGPLSPEELSAVEEIVCARAMDNIRVHTFQSSYQKAIEDGVTALFGEKYGDTVRVVQVPGFSSELCGGTHLASTGQLGSFLITSESGVAAGVRRIEAVTGTGALAQAARQREQLNAVEALLGSAGSDRIEKLRRTLEDKRRLEKELEHLKAELMSRTASEALADAEIVSGVRIHVQELADAGIDDLKSLCDRLRESGEEMVALVVSSLADKVTMATFVSDAVISRHALKAGELVAAIAPLVGGKGGGRPQLATAGGKDPAGLPAAIEKFRHLVREKLGAA
ncbi:MAG: alanine--tRNA ligase [Candidatus Delongbacteria bacterium]|nr:alanine--tRNA ligase [Candidatus Cloacimonadota bacterium]MCB9473232.1 alanine--tRNA ligase [Candidatus Delongbacteria bacterium]